MVAERPNAGAIRHQDRCGVIRRLRGGRFVPIVAHRITLTGSWLSFGKSTRVHFVFVQATAQCLVGGVLRTDVPGVRALLCKFGPGLKLLGRVRSALVSRVLCFD